MSTDKTWFDNQLKGNLLLDIAFRSGVWLCVAFITFKHVSKAANFSPVAGVESAFNVLLPVMTVILPWCMVLCFFALLLKDLEKVDERKWGQSTLRGRIGGVVRRLAGDLTLWILGALVSVISSVLVLSYYAYRSGEWSDELTHFVTVIGMVLGLSFALFACVSNWVRRDVSLISSQHNMAAIFNTPWKVFGFYTALIVFTTLMSRQ